MSTAAILTIGNELVSGDVPNTNASWLAKRCETLGVSVKLMAALPDEIDRIAEFIQVERPRVTWLLVTGGLGGTPDDLTREAVAAAFGVGQEEVALLADDLRRRFPRHPEYVARWAKLPVGSTPLVNPLGGAPGFAIENVYVLPGLPAEMEAMWLALEPKLTGFAPIGSWRRKYTTSEAVIVAVLEEATRRYPAVGLGSYPSFGEGGSHVELVLKSNDPTALAEASAWLEQQLADLIP